MAFELLETAETAQGVMIIVEYRNLHAIYLWPQLHHTPMS
jgi:hypothetical protein